ncbi:MAG: MerR family DNA-binding transcriptional regulator [Patescibacteria group bacterium]
MNAEKEFLSIKEAAKLIGVAPLTLRNWDKSGKFTASRHPINNYRVYKKAEILMLIEDINSKSWNTKGNKSQIDKPTRTKAGNKKLSVTHLDD